MRRFAERIVAVLVGGIFAAPLVLTAQDWFEASGVPVQRSLLNSADLRSEFLAIETGIADKLPPLTGNANNLVVVNGTGTALTTSGVQIGALDAANDYTYSAVSPAYAIQFTSAVPYFAIEETGAAADNQLWDFGPTTEQLEFRAVNDAGSIATNWLTVDRTGTTIDEIDLNGTLIDINGNLDVSGTLAASSATFASPLAVAQGGTGAGTLTGLLSGNGTGAITGGATINDGNWSGTDLAVANGGTGSSNATDARNALGLAIGTNVQAWDAHLDDLAGLAAVGGADEFMVSTGAGTWAFESAGTARTSLGVSIGSDVQAWDAHLDDLAALPTATGADLFMVSTAAGTWANENASTARGSLGLGSLATASTINGSDWSGTDLAVADGGTGGSDAATARANLSAQAQDDHLDDLAAITPVGGADQFMVSTGAGAWGLESASAARTSLGLGTLATLSSVNNGNWSGTDLAVVNGGTGASDAAGARSALDAQQQTDMLDDLGAVGAVGAADYWLVSTAAGTWNLETTSTARGSLGLGSLATASTVNNSTWSGTDLSIANGGTGASDAGTALANLGGGTHTAHLDDIAALSAVTGADYFMVSTAAGTWAHETGSTARGSLGLGSLATLSSINNGNWSGSDLSVANGGTGASTLTGLLQGNGTGAITGGATINNGNWSGTDLTVANGGTGASTLSGLLQGNGTGAITGGATINNGNWSGTDLAVANGGTGAGTAAAAATNLGLGTGNSPEFAAANLSSATATTLTGSAGKLLVEGQSALQHAGSYTSGEVTIQSGGSPTGGSNGDIYLIY